MRTTPESLPGAEAALAAAAIPLERRGSERTRRLSDRERVLYQWILRGFAAGEPPTVETIRDAAASVGVDVEAALARLAVEDLVHRDPQSSAILVAYPFAGQPRGHRVLIDGTRWVEAMCAIDALGIAAMLNASVEVSSHDPSTGAEIWVRIDPGDGAWWEPETAVVLAGRQCDRGPSFGGCCEVLNFFESSASAQQYLDDHVAISGAPISIPEAIDAGRILVGGVLEEA
jgi:Alkylmercury lyase